MSGVSARRGSVSGQLSGGENARAGLAIALAAAPALLLADEPTGEVDAETESRIFDLLDHERAGGMAALIATHSPDFRALRTRFSLCREEYGTGRRFVDRVDSSR